LTRGSSVNSSKRTRKYKVIQIWPGLICVWLNLISPGHIWTTLYNCKWRSKREACILIFNVPLILKGDILVS
jgi:hypothetical protein